MNKIEVVVPIYNFHKSYDYFVKPFKRMIESIDLNKFEICISDTGTKSSKPIFDSILADYRYFYEEGISDWMNRARTINLGVENLTENDHFIVSDADIVFPSDMFESIQSHLSGDCLGNSNLGSDEWPGTFDVLQPLICSIGNSWKTENPSIISIVKEYPSLSIITGPEYGPDPHEAQSTILKVEEIKFNSLNFKNSDVIWYGHDFEWNDEKKRAHFGVLFNKYICRWQAGVGGLFIASQNAWDETGGHDETWLVTEDIEWLNRVTPTSLLLHRCSCITFLHSDIKRFAFDDKEFQKYYHSRIRRDLVRILK